MKGLLALLRLWWDICRFKRDPADVPYSPALLIVVAACQWALAYAAWATRENWQCGLVAATIYVSTVLLLPYLVLLAAHKTARYVQMQAALLGTSLLLNLIAALLILSSTSLAQAIPFLENLDLVLFVIIFMVIWVVAVQGKIYQSALEKSRFVGICIAIFVLLASSNIFRSVMDLLQSTKAGGL